MRTLGVSSCALALVVVLGVGGVAEADDTGFASIHSWVNVGRKTCLADHFHSGSGQGPTRRVAERQAIQSWADYTAWEYGRVWGRYGIAASKKMNCERSSGWTCFVEARPCRTRRGR